MKDKDEGCLELTALFFAAGFVTVFGKIWEGFVLTKLWSWFIVSHFRADPISLPAAIGISVIVETLTHQTSSSKDESSANLILNCVVMAAVKPAIALAIGWFAKGFLP